MKTALQKLFNIVATKRNLIVLIGIQNTLSIVSVFSSPLPIPPKTSIGVLTGISILILVLIIFLYKKEQCKIQIKFQLIDFFVYGFIIANAVSLLCSQYIFDITNFRLLLSASIQYAALRFFKFTEREIQTSIHIIGVTTVIVAMISLFQIIFREQAIIIAKNFLFGDAAYSIASDLERGRGVQWGNIVITFPFFICSAMMVRKKKGILNQIYILLGIFLIPFSFIASNFRGLALCFFVGSITYVYFIFRFRFLSLKKIIPLVASLCIAISIGIMLTSFVFHYSLIDRFLLKEQDRDVKFTFGRVFLYEQALSAFSASPVFGIGTGNYRYDVDRIRVVSYYNVINGETGVKETEKEPVSSHNDILTILAETGLFGLVSYLGILYVVIKKLYVFLCSGVANSENKKLVSLAFVLSILMLLCSGLFENTVSNNVVYLFFLYGASTTWFLSKR